MTDNAVTSSISTPLRGDPGLSPSPVRFFCDLSSVCEEFDLFDIGGVFTPPNTPPLVSFEYVQPSDSDGSSSSGLDADSSSDSSTSILRVCSDSGSSDQCVSGGSDDGARVFSRSTSSGRPLLSASMCPPLCFCGRARSESGFIYGDQANGPLQHTCDQLADGVDVAELADYDVPAPGHIHFLPKRPNCRPDPSPEPLCSDDPFCDNPSRRLRRPNVGHLRLISAARGAESFTLLRCSKKRNLGQLHSHIPSATVQPESSTRGKARDDDTVRHVPDDVFAALDSHFSVAVRSMKNRKGNVTARAARRAYKGLAKGRTQDRSKKRDQKFEVTEQGLLPDLQWFSSRAKRVKRRIKAYTAQLFGAGLGTACDIHDWIEDHVDPRVLHIIESGYEGLKSLISLVISLIEKIRATCSLAAHEFWAAVVSYFAAAMATVGKAPALMTGMVISIGAFMKSVADMGMAFVNRCIVYCTTFLRTIFNIFVESTEASTVLDAVAKQSWDDTIVGIFATIATACIGAKECCVANWKSLMGVMGRYKGFRDGSIEFARDVRSWLEYMWGCVKSWWTDTAMPAPSDSVIAASFVTRANAWIDAFAANPKVTIPNATLLRGLIMEGDGILATKDFAKTSALTQRIVTERVKTLREHMPKLGPILENVMKRNEPVFVYLYSKPAQGKATIMNNLVAALIAKLFPEVSYEEYNNHKQAFIYNKTEENKYWSGYNHQFFFGADDIGQKIDEISSPSTLIWEIIGLNNSWAYPLNMAEVELKGNVYFTSPIGLFSSNQPLLQAKSVHSKEALWRRFNLYYEVILDDKYKDDQGHADPAKLLKVPTDQMMSIWRFQPYVPDVSSQTPKHLPTLNTFDEVVEQIAARYERNTIIGQRNDQIAASTFERFRPRPAPAVELQAWNTYESHTWNCNCAVRPKDVETYFDTWKKFPCSNDPRSPDITSDCSCRRCCVLRMMASCVVPICPPSWYGIAHSSFWSLEICWGSPPATCDYSVLSKAMLMLFPDKHLEGASWNCVHPMHRGAGWLYHVLHHRKELPPVISKPNVMPCHACFRCNVTKDCPACLAQTSWDLPRNIDTGSLPWITLGRTNDSGHLVAPGPLECIETDVPLSRRLVMESIGAILAFVIMAAPLAVMTTALYFLFRKAARTELEEHKRARREDLVRKLGVAPAEIEAIDVVEQQSDERSLKTGSNVTPAQARTHAGSSLLRSLPPRKLQSMDVDALTGFLKNVFTLKRASGLHMAMCFAVRGDYFVTARHVLTKVAESVDPFEELMLCAHDGSGKVFGIFAYELIKCLKAQPNTGDDIVMFARTDGYLPACRDRTRSIMEDYQPTVGRFPVVTWRLTSEDRLIEFHSNVLTQVREEDRVSYVHMCNSKYGESGRPLFALTRDGSPHFVAVLEGKSKEYGTSVYTPIPKGWIAKAVAIIDNLKGHPEIRLSEPIGTVVKQSYPFDDRVVPNYPLVEKTAYIRSPLSSHVDLPDLVVPANLRSFKDDKGEVSHPLLQSAQGWPTRSHAVSKSLVKLCARHHIDKMDAMISTDPILSCKDFRRTLTFEEAISGWQDGVLPSVMRNTSAGYPYVADKTYVLGRKYWLGTDEKIDFNSVRMLELRMLVDSIMSELRAGNRPEVFAAIFPKDELLSPEKVAAHKTRTIEALSFPYMVASRMLFGGFMTKFSCVPIYTDSAIGLNPRSHQWDRLASHLFPPGFETFDGDFGAFNQTIPQDVSLGCAESICDWYGPDDRLARLTAIRDYFDPARVVASSPACSFKPEVAEAFTKAYGCETTMAAIFRAISGMGQGHPLTATLNTLNVAVLKDLAFFYAVGSVDFAMLDAKTRSIIMGDDHVISTSEPRFNAISFNEFVSDLGCRYTTAHKLPVTEPYTDVSQLEFLKRGFRYDSSQDRWFAPLNLKSISKMVHWMKRGGQDEEYKQTINTCLQELSLHPQEVYDKYSIQIVKSWNASFSTGLSWTPYHEMQQLALSIPVEF